MSDLPELNKVVRVPLAKFAKYEKAFGREVTKALFVKAIRTAAVEVRELLELETTRRGIFYKGRYAKGWRIRKSENPAGTTATVFNRQKYAIVIEKGRRRGARRPPAAVLIPWVRTKLGLTGSHARSVAFAIARAIERRGIAARPVVGDARVIRKIETILVRAAKIKMQEAMMKVRP